MNIILKTNNLTKKYGKQKALDNFNMTIYEKDIYGFVGRNGAGKSTLMKLIMGLSAPTSGTYELFEVKNNSNQILNSRKNISGIIEQPAFYPYMDAGDNLKALALSTGSYNLDLIIDALKQVGLNDVKGKKVEKFSLGMKQRLSIAQAIMNKSKFIILDEPTNGLDPEGIIELRNIIKKLNIEQGITFLISSHYITELKHIINRMGIIKNGKMIQEDSINNLKLKTSLKIKTKNYLNTEATLKFLQNNFSTYDIEINNSILKFNGEIPDVNSVYSVLNSKQIDIEDMEKEIETLEDYVIRILDREK